MSAHAPDLSKKVPGGPPNMPPGELFARLTQRPRPHIVVDYPRQDENGNAVGQVAIWVLTQKEQIIVAANAEATARKLIKKRLEEGDYVRSNEFSRGYNDIYSNEAAVETLLLCCRDPQDLKRPIFRDAADVRELPVDEVGVLFEFYLQAQEQLGPVVFRMSDEAFELWLRRVEEAGSALPLASLSPEARNDFTTRLVQMLASYRTGTSSPGSELDATSNDSDSSTTHPSPNPEFEV